MCIHGSLSSQPIRTLCTHAPVVRAPMSTSWHSESVLRRMSFSWASGTGIPRKNPRTQRILPPPENHYDSKCSESGRVAMPADMRLEFLEWNLIWHLRYLWENLEFLGKTFSTWQESIRNSGANFGDNYRNFVSNLASFLETLFSRTAILTNWTFRTFYKAPSLHTVAAAVRIQWPRGNGVDRHEATP